VLLGGHTAPRMLVIGVGGGCRRLHRPGGTNGAVPVACAHLRDEHSPAGLRRTLCLMLGARSHRLVSTLECPAAATTAATAVQGARESPETYPAPPPSPNQHGRWTSWRPRCVGKAGWRRRRRWRKPQCGRPRAAVRGGAAPPSPRPESGRNDHR